MLWNFLFFLIGLTFLLAGAEGLVKSSSNIAKMFKVPPLLVGLTIVAYGTSSPELFVSSYAASYGKTDIALSNVVGSNNFNLLFILGATSLITPLSVNKQLIKYDIPFMILCSCILWAVTLWDHYISSWIGIVFLVSLLVYTWRMIKAAGKDKKNDSVNRRSSFSWKGIAVQTCLNLLSLGLLIVGSDVFLKSVVQIANSFGISERVIGLTFVSAGTSLPEAATSIIAAVKKEKDIAVGNLIGSNIFNILGVLGVSSLFASGGLAISPQAASFDIPFMAFSSFISLPLLISNFSISKLEGALLVCGYVIYISYLAF